MEFVQKRSAAAGEAGMIQAGAQIVGGAGRRVVLVPFVDVRVRIGGVVFLGGILVAQIIPAHGGRQLGRGDGHFEPVVHRLVIGGHIGAIEAPHEGIQPQTTKQRVPFGREFPGVVRPPQRRSRKSKFSRTAWHNCR